jgi:hypothetical protein
MYGDKRNYRKIDIYINGRYDSSTTWAKTLDEAIEQAKKRAGLYEKVESLKARYDISK